MKIISDWLRPGHADVVGKAAVNAQQPATATAFAGSIEMNDLARGMYTGIGSACTDDLYRFVRNQRQRFLETLLYPEASLLTLPAVVPGPVIFDAERDANVGAC